MPRFTMRMSQTEREALAEKARRAGVPDSVIARKAVAEFEPEEVTLAPPRPVPRSPDGKETLRRALPYLPDWPSYVRSWGRAKAEELLLERLDSPTQYVSLRRVDVGEVVLYGGQLYIVGNKALPGPDDKKGQPQPVCVLRLLGDRRKTIKVDAGQVVALPARLDVRLPPEYLSFSPLEAEAIAALSRGPRTLRQLYPQVHSRRGRGFDTSKQRVSRTELAQLAGRLMWGLVANDLVTFADGNPLVSAWSLTERGREAARFVPKQEVY